MSQRKVIIASHSKHKVKEIIDFFSQYPEINQSYRFESIARSTDLIPEENGNSFVENALIKARHSSKFFQSTAILSDDSGLCVPAINGEPGIYSSRFATMAGLGKASDEDNNQYLLKRLERFKKSNQRWAYFVTVLVWLRHQNDPDPIIVQARLYGEILKRPAGSYGFGYDPLFFLSQYKKSLAEISLEEKNKISHRAKALFELKNKLIECESSNFYT